MKHILFFILFVLFITNAHAQTGINFQGVARSNNNVILASQTISLRLSILQGSSSGNVEYTETRNVTTNAQGLFNVVIGDTGILSSTGNFANINWKQIPKFLKIEMDPAAGSTFILMGTTQFQYVPYAQFAKNIEAENIIGIIPVALGGTGVNSLVNLKLAMGLDKLNNTSDLSKPINNLTQNALDLKLNAVDTIKYSKQTYIDSALLTKLSTNGNAASALTALTAITAGTATKSITADTALTALTAITAGTATKSITAETALTALTAVTAGTATKSITAETALTALTAVTSGTASSATKLSFAKGINGVAFDGSKDIIITADAGTLTGTYLNATVTGSSLTNLGILQKATVNGKVIVGTSSETSSSAILEVNSTTQGFLPPRMTTVQRDLIFKPVAGLTIWNIDNIRLEVFDGSYWVTMNGKLIQSLNVGDNYGGGKVAYIFTSLDPGYVLNEIHGIIAAPTDQSSGIEWFNGTIVSTGAIQNDLGTGLSNTSKIINKQGGKALNYAAGIANAYNGGGFTDWFLPSKDELYKLYLNKDKIGGFDIFYPKYWSSSEGPSLGNIMAQIMNDPGNQYTESYNTKNRVRAIRLF
jgi:hypothetical protein